MCLFPLISLLCVCPGKAGTWQLPAQAQAVLAVTCLRQGTAKDSAQAGHLE